jgi:signal transduction histidine kinase
MNLWWRSRTLRFRLALWYGVGGTLLLALFSGTLYFYVEQRMAQPLGLVLRSDLEEVKQRIAAAGTPVETDSSGEYTWFEIWDLRGQLLQRNWPFDGGRLAEQPRAPTRRSEMITIFYVANDIRLRTLSSAYAPGGGRDDVLIRVMRLHESPADALDNLRWIIALALPIVVALLVAGGYGVTRRWLRPLALMVDEARQISPGDRHRRLPVVNPHDELGQLAEVFNETLNRLQLAFDALDRFVADASHEFRTPLATLRSVGEVGLRCSGTLEESHAVIRSMLEEGQRLQGLTERLLELAKAEGRPATLQKLPLELHECIAELTAEFAPRAVAREQRIVVEGPPCRVSTDPILFRHALHNIVDNALKHGPNRATVRIETRVEPQQVAVLVADDGPGIEPKHRAALMERFYRPDRGRDRASGGYGLGLSISKAFMRVLGGTLEYAPGEPTGNVFKLTLPR